MTAILNPYLHFRDTARQAMEFYHGVFGGELTVTTFGESGDPYPGEGEKVMHAQLETPSGFMLMASDVPNRMGYTEGENTASISISSPKGDEAELRGYWDKLAEGANITQAMELATWGATFGMLTDRFGVDWLVNISAED